jgi:lipopolysaccharide transport system permease protein
LSFTRELVDARHVLWALTYRDIRGQYRSTILGQLWSLANPLTQMLVYTFVFSFVFKVTSPVGDPSGVDSYALFLLCGLIPWSLFQATATQSMTSLLTNANLISKVYFPRVVIPMASSLATGYNSLFEFVVVVIALSVGGAFVLPWIPGVVLLVVLLLCFATGIGLALSIANMYFRDTQYLAGILFQVWMWLSPIIYPMTLVESRSSEIGPLFGTNLTVFDIYGFNPMVHFVSAFRTLMYDNRFPELTDSIACLVWSLASLAIGWLIFRRHEKKLAELL